MEVHLAPEFERLVRSKVESGIYESAREVIHDALRLLQQRDDLDGTRLQGMQKQIDQGLSEIDRGQDSDGETFMQALIEDLDQREIKRKAG